MGASKSRNKEPNALGQQLLARRRALELSQRTAAELIGISFPYLCQLETGKVHSPTLVVSIAIAKAYNLAVEELADWISQPKAERPKCDHCGQEIDP